MKEQLIKAMKPIIISSWNSNFDEKGKEAKEILINSNLRLVIKIAKDFNSLGLELQDLISEGNLGLVKAVENFKPNVGAKFSTYAAFWIKQKIRESIKRNSLNADLIGG